MDRTSKAVFRRLFAIVFLALLSGCATWAGHGLASSPQERLRIAVLPVYPAAEIRHLKDIATVPEGEDGKEVDRERVDQTLRQVADDMTRALEQKLAAGPYFEVVPHEEVRAALAAQGIPADTSSLTADQVKDLGAALNAGAILAVRLTGYGRLKKKWTAYLIGSGIVEGVVEGALVYGALKNIWAGLVVALQEIGQEVLTWGGGAYLFDMYYAPVTVEGALMSTTDGEEVWSHTTFVSIDRKALKKLPEEERKKKEVQLSVTVEKAEKDFVEELETSAKKNLRKKPHPPEFPPEPSAEGLPR